MDGWHAMLQRAAAAPGRVEAWTDSRPYTATGPGHLHPNPTMVVCLEGVMRVERAGRRLDLHPGDCLAIAAGIRHTHEAARAGSVHLGQGFLPRWSDVVVERAGERWFGRLPRQPGAGLVAAILAAPPDRARNAAAAWLRQLAAEPPVHSDYRQPVLWPMVELMWRRSLSGLTVDALVRASGASRTVAYEVFRRWYGLPPREAILGNRLTMAEALLAQGVPVAEVARRCGFTNPDTFTRCWRKAHGAAPRRWRRGLADIPPESEAAAP